MDAYGILVIILSITLAIFLVLAIVVAISVNKLLKKIHIITDKTLQAVENVESVAGSIKSVAEASVIGGIGAKLWKHLYDAQKKKK